VEGQVGPRRGKRPGSSFHAPAPAVSDLIYGRNAVLEALAGGRVRKVLLASGAAGAAVAVREAAASHGVPVQTVERRDLDRLAAGANHQGAAAEVSPFRYAPVEDLLAVAGARQEAPFLLILDCLQDPQNLGTLLRTAEAAGVHGVVIARHQAAEVTPAVVKASAGAVEHLRIAQETNLTKTILRLKDAGLWVAGLEDAPGAADYRQANLTGPLAVVVGSEGKGITRLVRETCDLLIRVPMRGKVGSLNAAVAGSLALYEVLRQRGL
jgi:23S rRNA (guanosine2251-2'-O)-methyltransferase